MNASIVMQGGTLAGWNAKSFVSGSSEYAAAEMSTQSTLYGSSMKISTQTFTHSTLGVSMYDEYGFYKDPYMTVDTRPIKAAADFYVDKWGDTYSYTNEETGQTRTSNTEVYFAISNKVGSNNTTPAFGMRIVNGDTVNRFDGETGSGTGWNAAVTINNISISEGEWHRLEYVYYPIDPNGVLNDNGEPMYPKGVVYYYIDGKCVSVGPQNDFSIGSYLGNAAFYGRSSCLDNNDLSLGNTSVIFDNINVTFADETPGETSGRFTIEPGTKNIRADWGSRLCIGANANNIKIEKFSKTDKMMQNPIELTENVDYIIAAADSCSVTVRLTEAAADNEQYRITISGTRDALRNCAVYTAEYNVSYNDGLNRTVVYENDFESYLTTREQATNTSVPSGFANAKLYAGAANYMFYSAADEEHGRYAVMETTEDSAAYGGMHKGSGISEISDVVELSYDFYFGELKGTNAQHSMWSGIVQGGTTSCNWRYGARIFHNTNQITSNGKNSEGGAISAWNDLNDVNRNAPGWNKFKMVYRKSSNDVLYYLNGELINKDGVAVAADYTLNQAALGNLVLGGGSAVAGAVIGFDNVKLSNAEYIKEVTYVKFADNDGNIIPVRDGMVPAGAKKIIIGTNGVSDIDESCFTLTKNGELQGFSGAFNDNVYTMTLNNMLAANTDYALGITGIFDANYSNEFTTGSGGLEINGFSIKSDGNNIYKIPETGDITAVADVKNTSNSEDTVYIITAAYKEGRLTHVDIQEREIAANTQIQTSGATLENAGTYDAVHAFVWDNIINITPLIRGVYITK